MRCSFIFLLLMSCRAWAGDIYVHPQGNDNSLGTKDSPLCTIQRAVRMAREWRRTSDPRTRGGVNIYLQSGETFYLDEPIFLRPEDSGTPDSKTVFLSTGKEKAVISGGISLSSHLSEKSASLNISSKKSKAPISVSWHLCSGRPLFTRSLWHSDKKLSLATAFGDYNMQRIIDFDKDAETITIPASALKDFGIFSIADAPQLEMVLHQRWAIAILRVKDFQFDGDKAILSFRNPESRWEFSHPWPQPLTEGERGASSFTLRNAKQFLDEENEWWQDYSTGNIYSFVPSDVTVPILNKLLSIEGGVNDKIHHLSFQNIAFMHSAWRRPETCGHVTLQGGFAISEAYKLTENDGLPWAKGLENQAWILRPEAAISVRNAENIDFTSCLFSHLASIALDLVSGCQNVRIEKNKFSDIGGTAILAGSFLEGETEVHRPLGMAVNGKRFLVPNSEYTENIDIIGNTVSDAANEDWGAVGIACGFVRNTRILHNSVSKVNYCGICVGWGWTPEDTGMRNNKIIGNNVSDYARILYDAGGIYTMSNQPNSIITGNTVSAPHLSPYATNFRAFPIYFDACTDGYSVYSNRLQTNATLKEKYGYNNPGPAMKVQK